MAGIQDGLSIRERGLAHPPHSFAAAGALAVLLVRGEVERDEEEQIRAENSNTRKGRKLLASAPAGARKPLEVG